MIRPDDTHEVTAVFENGVLKPLERLDLVEHAQVRLTIRPIEEGHDAGATQERSVDPLAGVRVDTGITDLAEHFDDYRFGRRKP